MPCGDAMITEVISARSDQTVAEVLALFEEHNIRGLPVVDKDNNLVGVYNFKHMLMDLMPFPVDEKLKRIHILDMNLDHIAGGKPWVERQLTKLLDKKMSDVMIKEPHYAHESTSLREGIRLLVKYGSPIVVVKKDSMEVVGVVSSQSIVKDLRSLNVSVNKGA